MVAFVFSVAIPIAPKFSDAMAGPFSVENAMGRKQVNVYADNETEAIARAKQGNPG